MLVGLFFLGGIVGAAGYLAAGFSILIAPALVLLAAAAPPLVEDLCRGRGVLCCAASSVASSTPEAALPTGGPRRGPGRLPLSMR